MTTIARTLDYSRPWLYAKQEAAIFCDERYSVIEASTKSGKTVGCMVWLGEKALLGKRKRNYWWIAPIYSQAKIAYKRLKDGLPRGLYIANDSAMTITLMNNGSIITFKGGDNPDSLYGEDVYAAVIDEASRCKEEVWHAVRSTLTASNGDVRIIGNVKGRKNWAYQLARKAESGVSNWRYSKITAADAVAANVLKADEVAEAQRDLPEQVFKELYLAEPSDDQGNPFGIDAIYKCVAPMSNKEPVCWGWDLAKSVDWTWGIGLDEDGAVCRSERWQSPWEETLKRIVNITAGVPALVDSTGVGDAILEFLAKAGSNFEGFKFTSTSKQQLMERLAVAIQQQQITFPEGQLFNELLSFEYVYTRTGAQYSAPSGLHDDGVCSLALAVYHQDNKPGIGVWL